MAEDTNSDFKPVSPDPKQASTAPMNPQTAEQAKAAMERQHKLTERIQAQKGYAAKPGNAEIDTKLTTADHVGQHPAQPFKPQAHEAAKVGDFARIGAKEGDTVQTTPVAPINGAVDGPTDHVTLQPGETDEEAAERVKNAGKPPGGGEVEATGETFELTGHGATAEPVPASGASVHNGDGKGDGDTHTGAAGEQ